MEQVVEPSNMRRAYKRVLKNRGAAGVDRLAVEELKDWLLVHWSSVKTALLEGRYLPRAVRRVDIPKSNGGVRTLGVPTVVDRLIQQALHQVLQPIFEPTFSDGSYGFRPQRSALNAVAKAKEYVADAKHWVVDIDLEKFFDRVNHDVLMARLAYRVKDSRVLKLIRRFLEAGMMADGVIQPRNEGTPQGGPLSPLLSNILLTDLDRELERRQLKFCRYADDCNIYVGSESAGQRAMANIRAFLEGHLKLRINEQKSAVARPWKRKFLGYAITIYRNEARVRAAPQSLRRLMDRVRELLRKGRFDELFFVDLPDPATRAEIFALHLDRRGLPRDQIDLSALAAAADGYSGAEIEQVIVSALYAAHAAGSALDTHLLMQAIRDTRPLSVVMAEQVQALRAWALPRTIPAD